MKWLPEFGAGTLFITALCGLGFTVVGGDLLHAHEFINQRNAAYGPLHLATSTGVVALGMFTAGLTLMTILFLVFEPARRWR